MLGVPIIDARRLFGNHAMNLGASDPRSWSAERAYAYPIRHGETCSVSREVNRGAKQELSLGEENRGAKQ